MHLIKTLLCIIATGLLLSNITAQISDSLYKSLPDSLRPVSKTILTPKEKIRLINSSDVSFINHYLKDFASLVSLMDREMEAASDTYIKVNFAVAISNYYKSIVKYDSAFKYYHKTINYGLGYSDYNRQVAAAYIDIGTYYAIKFKVDSAVNYLHKGLEATGNKTEPGLLVFAYNAYTIVYQRLKLYDSAVNYTERCIKAMPATDLWGDNYTMLVIGKADLYEALYKETGKKVYADSALSCINQVMQQKKNEPGFWYMQCYFLFGKLSFLQDDFKASLAYFDSCLLPKNAHLYLPALETKLYRAICLHKLGDRKGIAMLESLILPAKQFEQLQLQNKVLYEDAKAKGNWSAALSYHEKYIGYTDSIDLIKQRGHVFEIEQKYQAAKNEASIAKLENDNFRKEKEKQHIIYITVIISLILIVALVTAYFAYKKQQGKRIIERQQLTDELQKMEREAELQRYRSLEEKEQAIKEEQKRISRNMHDEISSGMAALTFFVGDMKRKALDEHDRGLLEQIEKEAGSMYSNARNFMHSIYNNTVMLEYNVTQFLKELVSRFGASGSMHISCCFDEEVINNRLLLPQHTELYCVIREAVANSMKYAGATQLNINLQVDEDSLYFEITDNGRGIYDKTKAGLGLQSIRERISRLNGSVEISILQSGSKIAGNFPLEHSVEKMTG